METSAPLKPAAAILLSRRGKIWLGQRGQTRFLPGFSVFPGGGVEKGESFHSGALRELEEETGLTLDSQSQLVPFARAITPAYSKYRFDVRVYHVELSENSDPVPDGQEFVGGDWYSPSQVLESRTKGDLQLAPPTYRQVVLWAKCVQNERPWPSEEEAFADPPARNEQVLPFLPNLTVIPVRTRALPPAAWTNTTLIGTKRLFVLDPGGDDLSVVKAEIAERCQQGAKLEGVILSHHHQDHLAGALQLEAPIYCHDLAVPHLPADFPEPHLLKDGSELDLDGTQMRFHHTPGHAPGHLAIELPQSRTILAGDMISSLSSIVIPSDHGDLMDYLGSLRRLNQLQSHLIIPAHGPPFGRGSQPFQQALLHRDYRERQVLAALKKAPSTPEQVVKTIYPGLDEGLWEAALCNVHHYLKKMQLEGQVEQADQGWQLLEPSS